jgi:hypothetical protein
MLEQANTEATEITIPSITEQVNKETTEIIDDDKKKKTQEKSEISSSEKVEDKEPTLGYAEQIIEWYKVPAKTSKLGTEEEEWEKYKDGYIKKAGGDEAAAKEEFSKVYEQIAKSWQKQAEKEHNTKVLSSMESMVFGLDDNIDIVSSEDYSLDVEIVPQTLSGRLPVLDGWTDPTRSMRQAALSSKKYIDANSDIKEYEQDAYDELVYNKNVKDDKGREIVGMKYTIHPSEYSRIEDGSPLFAVYEGETEEEQIERLLKLGYSEEQAKQIVIQGELVSAYDTSDSWLASNGIDVGLLKVTAGSILDFFVDTADTALALGEFMNYLTFDYAGLTKWQGPIIRDWRMYLQGHMMSKSDKDQQNILTWNNAVNMGINVGLQLLTAKAMATAGAKLAGLGAKAVSKIKKAEVIAAEAEEALALATKAKAPAKTLTALEKTFKEKRAVADALSKSYNTSANIIKRSNLFMMGAMQAKATGDEARKAGYSDFESALIFFASLGTMMWVNELSDLGFESAGLNLVDETITKTTNKVFAGYSKKATSSLGKFWNNTKKLPGVVKTNLDGILKRSPILGSMVSEGIEEEAEYVMDQVVRHVATAISTIGYSDDDIPKFQTVFDKGYFEQAGIETLLNLGGGMIGGAMSGVGSALVGKNKKLLKTSELPVKGQPLEVIQKIAHLSDKTDDGKVFEAQLLSKAAKAYKKGEMGRHDLSVKYNEEKQRFYRMNELSDEDKKRFPSQAEVQYRAFIGEYFYFKSLYKGETKKFDEITKENPQFKMAQLSNALFNDTRALLDKKVDIYTSTEFSNDVDIDKRIKELSALKKKIEYDEDGNIKNGDKYLDKLRTLSSATNLSAEKIEELIKINDNLEAIHTGKILHNAFIELEAQRGGYKKINKDRLKSIIFADEKSKEKFKRELEEKLKLQKESDAKILEIIKKEPTIEAFELIMQLIEGKSVYNISEGVKEDLKQFINSIGDSFESKQTSALEVVLADIKAAVKNNVALIMTRDPNSSKLIKSSIVEDIEDAIIRGDVEEVNKIINSHADSFYDTYIKALVTTGKLDKAVAPSELPTALAEDFHKTAYMFQQLKAITRSSNLAEFNTIVYDPSQVEIKEGHNGNITDGLLDGQLGYKSNGNTKILELINISLLDVEKFKLSNKINRFTEVSPNEIKDDILYYFTENSVGNIESTNMSIIEKYNSMVDGYRADENGNVIMFGDLKGAEDLLNVIETRMEEAKFILSFLPQLYQLHQIHKQFFDNKLDNNLTFLTSYIDNHVLPFDQFIENPSEYYSQLNASWGILNLLHEKAKSLVESAKNVSVNLEKVYVENAVAVTKTRLDAVKTLLSIDSISEVVGEDQAVEDIIATINNIDFDDTSQSNISDVFDRAKDVRKKLKKLHKEMPQMLDRIADAIGKSNIQQQYFKHMLLLTLADDEVTFSYIKTKYENQLKEAFGDKAKEAKLTPPTMPQIMWIEEGVTAYKNKDYLRLLNKISSGSEGYDNIIVFSGRLGTGKTAIVSNVIASIIHEMQPGLVPVNKVIKGTLFASNYENIVQDLKDHAKHLPLASINGSSSDHMTGEKLWKLLVENKKATDEELADLLDNVSVIVYDEISNLQFRSDKESVKKSKSDNNDDVYDAPILNAILGKLARINKIRELRKEHPILMIGLGDSKQGGFVEGMKTPKTRSGEKETMGARANVFTSGASRLIHKSSVELEDNFRSKVDSLTAAPDKIIAALTSKNTETGKLSETKFAYNKEGDLLIGVKINRSWEEIIADDSETIDSIEKNIKEYKSRGEVFTVLLVSGEETFTSERIPKDSRLAKLMKQYPESFNTFGIFDVQGKQAHYTLIDMPNEFLPIDQDKYENNQGGIPSEVMHSFRDRVSRIAQAVGRSEYFTHLSFTGGFNNISSEEAPVSINTQDALAEFRVRWSKLLTEVIFKTYGTTETTEEEEEDKEEKDKEEKESNEEEPLNKEDIALNNAIQQLNAERIFALYPSATKHKNLDGFHGFLLNIVEQVPGNTGVKRLVIDYPNKGELVFSANIPPINNGFPIGWEIEADDGTKLTIKEILENANSIGVRNISTNEYLEAFNRDSINKKYDDAINALIENYGKGKEEEIKTAVQKAVKESKNKKEDVVLSKVENVVKTSEVSTQGGVTIDDHSGFENVESIKDEINAIAKKLGLENGDIETIEKEINTLKATLKDPGALKTDTIALLNNKLAILKNIFNILLGNFNEAEVTIFEEKPDDSDESSTSTEYLEGSDVVKKAEKEYRLGVIYSHFGKNLSHRTVGGYRSSEENKISYFMDVYDNLMSDPVLVKNNTLRALGLGKDGKKGMDEYTFILMSSEYKPGQFNHALFGRTKNGELFPIAQFPPIDYYDESSPIYKMLNDRIEAIKNREGTKQSASDIVYLESELKNPKSVIIGATVGSLVTTSNALTAIADEVPFIKENYDTKKLINGRMKLGSIHDKSYINRFKNNINVISDAKELSKAFDTGSQVFQPITEQNGEKKYIAKDSTGKLVLLVNTSKGLVAFVNTRSNVWVPALGATKRGTIVTNNALINYRNKEVYDSELKQISDGLKKLDKDIETLSKHVMSVDTLTDIVNDAMGLTAENIPKNNSKESQTLLLNFYKNRKNNYLGNINIPLNQAEVLWKSSGSPTSYSKPYTIMSAGENSGKSVIFYTFRSDIDLSTMTDEEILNLYRAVNKEINDTNGTTNLSNNRLGIGMILLDSKKFTFKSAEDYIHSSSLTSATTADINKVITSGKVEEHMSTMLAAMYKVLLENETNKIVDQLLEGDTDEYIFAARTLLNKYSHSELQNLRSLLTTIFSKRATGNIQVSTNDVDLQIVMNAVRKLEAQGWDEETLDKALEEVFDGLGPEVRNKLAQLHITNAMALKTISITSKTSKNSPGFLLKNNNNKVVLRGNENTVILAADAEMLERIEGNRDSVPKAKVDIKNLTNILRSEFDSDSRNLILEQLDEVRSNTPGIMEGFYISPLVIPTGDPLVPVTEHMYDGNSILETTVKQINMPAAVFDIDLFTKSLTDANEDSKESLLLQQQDATVTDLNARIDKTNDISGLNTLATEINLSNISEESKQKLHTAINNKVSTIINSLDSLDSINFDVLLNPTNAEERRAVNALETLKSYTISDEVINYIWNNIDVDNIGLNQSQIELVKMIIEAMNNGIGIVKLDESIVNLDILNRLGLGVQISETEYSDDTVDGSLTLPKLKQEFIDKISDETLEPAINGELYGKQSTTSMLFATSIKLNTKIDNVEIATALNKILEYNGSEYMAAKYEKEFVTSIKNMITESLNALAAGEKLTTTTTNSIENELKEMLLTAVYNEKEMNKFIEALQLIEDNIYYNKGIISDLYEGNIINTKTQQEKETGMDIINKIATKVKLSKDAQQISVFSEIFGKMKPSSIQEFLDVINDEKEMTEGYNIFIDELSEYDPSVAEEVLKVIETITMDEEFKCSL